MAYLSAIEDQEPWRMVAEDASQEFPRLSSVVISMIGAEEKIESNVT